MSRNATPAGIIRRSRVRSVSRTASRRFGLLPAVIATVGAILAIVVPASSASASGQGPTAGYYQLGNMNAFGGWYNSQRMCLDAYAQAIGDLQPIIQWGCDSSHNDQFENWKVTDLGGGLYQLKNAGAGDCLDSNAQYPYQGSHIIQFTCNSSDPYQQWYINPVGGGAWSLKNVGASNRAYDLGYTYGGLCLDADGNQQGFNGGILQINCNTNDGFQLWYLFSAPAPQK